MSAIRDHKIFRLRYTYSSATGVWHAQDSFEATGWRPAAEIENIVAPSLEVAMAWLNRRHAHTKDFLFQEVVDELRIAAFIQDHVW